MPRITLIIGLPASGKSTLARKLGADLIVDDPNDLNEIVGKTFEHMVIVHYALCDHKTLLMASTILRNAYPDADIAEQFFDNNPKQCLLNARRRPGKSVDQMIRHMSDIYSPPFVHHAVWSDK